MSETLRNIPGEFLFFHGEFYGSPDTLAGGDCAQKAGRGNSEMFDRALLKRIATIEFVMFCQKLFLGVFLRPPYLDPESADTSEANGDLRRI